ncbi:HNH endonuclease [Pseudomonas phage hairong]|nr:HNH endonuclease [Pseudomonas phage hairong]
MSWATIPRFPDYLISDKGEVMSYRPKNGRGPSLLVGRLMKPSKVPGKKYFHLPLLDVTGTRIYRKIHLLVLEAFIGPCPAGMQGCHKDDDQTNNSLSNLKWGTHAENVKDKIANGKQVRGEKVTRSVLTDSQVQEIIDAIPTWKHGTGRHFAKKFGVGDSAISSVKNRLTWTHIT